MEAVVDSAAAARKRWKRVLILGLVLLPGPLLGFVGMVAGMLASFRRVQQEEAPLPEEVTSSVKFGQAALLVGLAVGLVGALLVTLAFLRLARLRASVPEQAGGTPWR